jgi:carboxyl-terminal processing protease
VQSVIQLQDGSALRLTTAKYFTPSKQVIHEKGVSPTIRATLTPEQERTLMALRQEDPSMDPERAKEIASFRDSQLERAVDALKGVMIYAEKSSGAKPAAAAN